jgi:hypothetical protein
MQGPRSTLFAAALGNSAVRGPSTREKRIGREMRLSDRSMLWNSCESASKYRTREFENENNGGKAPVAAANVILRSIS